MTTEQRIRVGGVPGYVDPDDPDRDTPFEKRRHRCYELAGRYVTNARQSVTLVHGTIRSDEFPDLPPLEHAWVLLHDTGGVFEPTSGHRMPTKAFEEWARPSARAIYEEHNVYVLTARTRHWGPWDRLGEGDLSPEWGDDEPAENELL